MEANFKPVLPDLVSVDAVVVSFVVGFTVVGGASKKKNSGNFNTFSFFTYKPIASLIYSSTINKTSRENSSNLKHATKGECFRCGFGQTVSYVNYLKITHHIE